MWRGIKARTPTTASQIAVKIQLRQHSLMTTSRLTTETKMGHTIQVSSQSLYKKFFPQMTIITRPLKLLDTPESETWLCDH